MKLMNDLFLKTRVLGIICKGFGWGVGAVRQGSLKVMIIFVTNIECSMVNS